MGRRSAGASGLYGRRWRKAREVFLGLHPLCQRCSAEGVVKAAQEINHKQKHNGDLSLFWDEANWEPICAFHHRSVVGREERSGKAVGCDEQGNPIGRDW